jgi:integrase
VASRRQIRTQIAAARKRSAERRQLREQLESVRAEWRKVRTGLRTTELKSARSCRTILMPAIVVTALKGHRTSARRAARGGRRLEGERARVHVADRHGAQFAEREPGVSPASQGGGLAVDPFSRSAAHGCDVVARARRRSTTIMETLGHSQISLTLNTYSHVLPALQADAAFKMNAILTRGSSSAVIGCQLGRQSGPRADREAAKL